MADDLRDILATARQNLPDVPDSVWTRFESLIRKTHGARRVYIQAQKKQSHLEAIAAAGAAADNAELAKKLGLSVGQIWRLKKLVE